VDAAATGDTVIVWPCVYTDVHVEDDWNDVLLNVYFEKGITLMSSDGAATTIIDGEGAARYGVVALRPGGGYPYPVVEGFTVRNGSTTQSSTGVYTVYGDVMSNVVEGFRFGIRATGVYALVHGNACMDNETGITVWGLVGGAVDGNTVHDNDTGLVLRASSLGPTSVAGNVFTGNEIGIRVQGESRPGELTLVGNSVSGNTQGIYVSSAGESWTSTTLHVAMDGNQVFDNSEVNVRVAATESEYAGNVVLEMGGSLDSANDLSGAPLNIHASQEGSAVATVIATHNYWGSTLCSEFVPLFLLEDVSELDLEFLPFTDETHTELFPACESSQMSPTSWGYIKALYQ
jgi:hypothetical protein